MQQYPALLIVLCNSGPDEWPTPVQGYKSIGTPFIDTTRVTNLVDASTELNALLPGGRRVMWWTLNIKVDTALTWDIFEKGRALFAPHVGSGIEWAFLAQPIPISLIRKSRKNGGNLSGLSAADGNQFLLLGGGTWVDESDDVVVKGLLNEILSWATSTAAERGKLVRFIYPNYAAATQDVLASFGPENVEQMKKVQAKYDPELLWPKYWQGGFRL